MSEFGSEVQLSEWITQLFRGQNVAKVNELLFEFNKSKSSWNAALTLINSPVVYIRFFSANIVYGKIRKDSSQLSENERQDVFRLLFDLISRSAQVELDHDSKVFVDRIILCLIAVSFRIPNGVPVVLKLAEDLINSRQPLSIVTGLRLLQPLPEELENSDISSSLREELTTALSIHIDSVYSLLDALSESTIAPELVLTVAHRWCGLGMSLSSLHSSHAPTYRLFCAALTSPRVPVLLQAWQLLEEVITVTEFPHTASRDAIVVELLLLVAQRRASLDPSDEDALTQLCNTLVVVGVSDLRRLTSQDPRRHPYFSLLLSVLSLPPRRLLMLSFDLWPEVQDAPWEELHPLFRSEVAPALLSAIVSLCRYSSQVEEDEEQREDWATLRDPRLGLGAVIDLCAFAMRSELFPCLFALLSAQTGDAAAQLEAVLYVVSNIDCLKELLDSRSPLYDLSLVANFLFELTSHCLALQDQLYSTAGLVGPLLHETVCRFLGHITFLLTKSTSAYLGREVLRPDGLVLEFKELFQPALLLLLPAVASPHRTVASCAARSLHQLCVHGSKWLTSPVPALQGESAYPALGAMIASYGQFVQTPSVEQEGLLVLTESLVRSVVAVAEGPSQQLLFDHLCEPLVVSLTQECGATALNVKRLHQLLALVSQLIRFCDLPVQSGSHVLLPLLGRVWPLLEQIGSASAMDASEQGAEVRSVIFEIFGRVFASLGPLALSQADPVAGLILSVLRARSPAACAALKCASSLVEFLSASANGLLGQYGPFLQSLLSSIVAVYASALPQPHLLLADLEALQQLYSLLYTYLIFCPSVVGTSPAVLSPVVELCLVCAEGCSEREPLRAAYQVLQYCFCPGGVNSTPALQQLIREQCAAYGERTTALLLRQVSGSTLLLSLAPNLSEVLLALINGCPVPALCHRWFQAVIVGDASQFTRLETPENRVLLLDLLFYFAQSNTRRFKVLLQDTMKICASELTVDALMAYSDVLAR